MQPREIVEFPMFWLIEKVDFMPNLLLATFIYTRVSQIWQPLATNSSIGALGEGIIKLQRIAP